LTSTTRSSAAAALAALLLAGCGGAANGVVPAAGNGNGAAGTHSKAAVRVRVRIPAAAHTSNGHLRHMHFISVSTNALKAQIYPPNSTHGPSTLIATFVTDLSGTSTACTPNSDGSRSCTFTIAAPPPADDFVFTTWNQAPVDGLIPAAAKQLAAANVVDQSITVGKANAIAVTLGGIVASIQLKLPFSIVAGGVAISNIHGVVASKQNLGVNALDAGGNVIVSDGYVDANGNPQSITVGVTAASGSCGSGTLQLGGATPSSSVALSAPAASGVQFNYGASSLAAVFTHASPCTFAIVAALGNANASGRFALLGPEFTEYPTLTSGASPWGITEGSDDAMWFTEIGVSKIGRIPLTGSITESVTPTANSQPAGITFGPDGNVWFVESQAANLGTSTLGGTVTEPVALAAGSAPSAITEGFGDDLWFTEGGASKIAQYTLGGSVVEYATPTAASHPMGISVGADGAFWFTESASDKIGRVTTSGAISEPATLAAGSTPGGITAGEDGALWFAQSGTNKIGRITTAGVLTQPATLAAGSDPLGITSGPDGALWVTEFGGNKIARVTTAGALTEYAIPTTGSQPNGIAVGADGALWFTESHASKIGRLTW
jgi:virginiamycin B lyase